MKKILSFIIIAAILTTSVLSLSSCEKPDIYVLLEKILQNKEDEFYTFDADLNIKINKSYLKQIGLLYYSAKQFETIPDELDFKIDGMVNQNDFSITFEVHDDSENQDIKTGIYKRGDVLYVELNDVSRIVFDLLYSAGFIDMPVKILFDGEVEYNDGFVMVFDLKDFDLKMFDKYTNEINKIFTVKSSVKYNFLDSKNIPDVPLLSYDAKKILYFNDVKNNIKKELLKLPGYRYSELYIVLETDENKNNFINILAARENGEVRILEKVKLDCDLSKVRKNPELIYSENIIPMRYLFELLGETVEWDAKNKKAYIIKDEKNIYFEGKLINSKTYISLLQVMTLKDYMLNSVSVDEYIEFKIARK